MPNIIIKGIARFNIRLLDKSIKHIAIKTEFNNCYYIINTQSLISSD
jgi:hypothetical protein